MLEARSLSKSFSDIRAVDGVSFSAKKGEVVGFLGPNGAGKSTTMKMLTGFLVPDEGEALVGGMKVTTDSVGTRDLTGYLPENAPLYTEMSVREFLLFISEVRGLSGRDRANAFDRVVDQVSLQSVLNRKIEKLSKGFRRRVGLAQAIIHDPELLILDEPTDGLDPNQKHEVRKLINRLSVSKCIILSTHILEEVDEVCTRAIIVSEGKVVADDNPLGLKERAKSAGNIEISFDSQVDDTFREEVAGLEEFREIHEYEELGGVTAFTLYLSGGDEGLKPLIELVGKHNLKVTRLNYGKASLDNVFRELTR